MVQGKDWQGSKVPKGQGNNQKNSEGLKHETNIQSVTQVRSVMSTNQMSSRYYVPLPLHCAGALSS